MDKTFDLYRDIAERTDGDVYIGVVGPVRTGKSTLIKQFMEKLVLPAVDKAYKISLRQYLPRFRCIDRGQVLFDDGVMYDLAEDWRLEGDDVLILPGMPVGVYTIWYRAYPQVVTRETPDGEEIDLAPEAVVLLPLYMAAELYKEDDLALATVLRNEYEDGLEKLRQSYEDSGSGLLSGSRRNTTGWW